MWGSFNYPKGDWSTRIPGLTPLMPAVNSKAVRKALARADAIARAHINETLRRAEAELAAQRQQRPAAADAMEDDAEAPGRAEAARRRQEIIERWGTAEPAELDRWVGQGNREETSGLDVSHFPLF